MKAPVSRLAVVASSEFLANLQLGLPDLLSAAGAETLETSEGEFAVEVKLAGKAD
jgi:hypothetical protein